MNHGWRIVGIAAAFLLVFVFGAILGISGTILYAHGRIETARAERGREQAEQRLREREQRMEQVRVNEALRRQVAQLQARLAAAQKRLPAPEQFGARLMERFVSQLHPTDEQRAKIQPMVNQTAEELRRLRRDTGHNTELALEKLEDQIATVLTPAQRDHFNDLIQRWREAFQRFNRMQQERQVEQRLREQQQRQQEQLRQQELKGSSPSAPAPAPAPTS